jgi:glycine cleavage system aminomethyltransferase T/glycine/D-amino acid oxidase-like deaminating enzyme
MMVQDSSDLSGAGSPAPTASPGLPARAQVVVIGGGVIGASVAYHLTRLGWTDVLLLERHQLTSGTTWHAAGLITSAGMADETSLWMSRYSRDLYERLEEETGLSTGFRAIGHISLASTPRRLEALRREAAFARGFGVDDHEISPAEVAEMWPFARTDDILAGFLVADEGRANPVDVCMSLARGARMRGARIVEGVPVTGVTTRDGRVTGVVTAQGIVETEHVVNCAGMWARQLGALAGVDVPLQAAEHYYLLTEPFEGVHRDLPVIEDPDRYGYYREEGDGLLVGLFEPVAAPWRLEGVPTDSSFTELPPDWDRLGPYLQVAMDRVPVLADVGIRKFFCGPESFTSDVHPLLGPAPELDGFWVAAGLNSLGILLGGGVGSVVAQWMVDGVPPVDVAAYAVERALPHEASRRFRAERTVEQLGVLFGDAAWPTWQPRTARGVRRSPLLDRFAAAGAHFGVSAGWEYPEWFAGPDQEPVPDPSEWSRPPSFARVAEEHRAVRAAVGVMDMTLMAKLEVVGPDAVSVLGRLSAGDVDRPVGRITYTQWLDRSGGIQADLTVTRLGEQRFLVVASDIIQRRVGAMIRRERRPQENVHVTDVTSGTVLLSVQGPRSRELLSRMTPADVSDAAFGYLTARELELDYARVLAMRVTYVGELGYELHVPTEYAPALYDTLMETGQDLGIRNVGLTAMGGLRLEKGYRDFGVDIDNTDNPLEVGLGFAVAFDKPGGFVGRDALLAVRDAGPRRRAMVSLLLEDPDIDLFGNEPVLLDGRWVGYVRAAGYGHTLGGAVGLATVENEGGVTEEWLAATKLEVECAGHPCAARASLRPLYDPGRRRILS